MDATARAAPTIEHQYRRFLLLASGATFLAAAVELLLVEHYADRLQILPFVLIALGVAAILWAWRTPEARPLCVLRWVAGAVVLGSLVGIGLHVKGNLEFSLEVAPEAPLAERVWDAVGGGSPLLAPGMLALAAILAAASTYRHPAVGD